jgi:hypothetical protein
MNFQVDKLMGKSDEADGWIDITLSRSSVM